MIIATLGDGIELRLMELVKAERVGDEWADNLIYGMLDEEWQAQGRTRQV